MWVQALVCKSLYGSGHHTFSFWRAGRSDIGPESYPGGKRSAYGYLLSLEGVGPFGSTLVTITGSPPPETSFFSISLRSVWGYRGLQKGYSLPGTGLFASVIPFPDAASSLPSLPMGTGEADVGRL